MIEWSAAKNTVNGPSPPRGVNVAKTYDGQLCGDA